MSKIRNNTFIYASLFVLSLGSGVCSGVYQKAMLDEESQRYLTKQFVEPMQQSEHAEGVHFFSEDEFHITLAKVSAPSALKSELKCNDENAVGNVFNFTNGKLKREVSKTHEVLSDITFKIKGVNVMGMNPQRKFLVCEVEPVLDDCDRRTTTRVKQCFEGVPHVSLARIDDAATLENTQRTRTLCRVAQDALGRSKASDPVSGRKKERGLRISKICAENGRDQTLMTSKAGKQADKENE